MYSKWYGVEGVTSDHPDYLEKGTVPLCLEQHTGDKSFSGYCTRDENHYGDHATHSWRTFLTEDGYRKHVMRSRWENTTNPERDKKRREAVLLTKDQIEHVLSYLDNAPMQFEYIENIQMVQELTDSLLQARGLFSKNNGEPSSKRRQIKL